jgi:tetratricopeptide (TPR) repeat protein
MLKYFYLLFFSMPIFASSYLESGIIAYDQGDYSKAISEFEAAIKDNKSGDLYYNLGNAYYRNSELGKAMAAFLEARRLLPRDPDIRTNLDFAKKQVTDQLATELPTSVLSVITFWKNYLSIKEIKIFLSWFSIIALLLLLVSQILRQFYFLKMSSYLCLGFSFLLFCMLQLSKSQEYHWGSVTENIVKVYSGPQVNNTVLFELHQGAPFACDSYQGEWVKILLSDGKKGWLQLEKAKVFAD